ncbi:MAG: sigma 54-interacting transcriptional regulator [Myxococcales bacterium]|nr:sigma 54-interacting transcriptional regulator [Myxococcales bacterium]
MTTTIVDGETKTGLQSVPDPGVVLLFAPSLDAYAPHVHALRDGGQLTVGRNEGQSIAIVDDASLSREHAVLRRSGAAMSVRDLGSSGGTFVNGVRVPEATSVPLRYGDLVRCGGNLLMCIERCPQYAGWPARARVEPLLGGPAIEQVRRLIEALAPRVVEVLIVGESGTGKELAARMVHEHSGRTGQFVPVNCAALPESLIEAELFGAKRGAFTGANTDRAGLFVQAEGGTLFLDEVGELPLPLQPKLLRALELGEVRAVGSDNARRVDVRLVFATNRDLGDEAAAGRFRQDLLYRIRGATIAMPPLRERREDVVLLCEHVLARIREREQRSFELTARFLEQLALHHWPGNVRELERAIGEATVQATVAGSERLARAHLRDEIRAADGAASGSSDALAAVAQPPQDEAQQLRAALERTGGNVSAAATELGISRSEIYRRMKQHGVKAEDFRV